MLETGPSRNTRAAAESLGILEEVLVEDPELVISKALGCRPGLFLRLGGGPAQAGSSKSVQQ